MSIHSWASADAAVLTQPATSDLILIVEDEEAIAQMLETYLRHENFRTERAADGLQALALFRASQPDLVLLDILLPKLDGWELLKTIRQKSRTPVIMTTALADEVDRLVGLGLGADDYIVKPYSFREVVARVKAVLRRARPELAETSLLKVGRLTIDMDRVIAHLDSVALTLTATEFRLLAFLARAPGRVFSRAELITGALPESDMLERSVDTHLKNLRRKLNDLNAADLLQTVRGMGYKLVAPA